MNDTAGSRLMLAVVAVEHAAAAETALRALAGDDEVRALTEGAFAVHASVDPAAMRDAIAAALPAGARVFVAEFERWSASGEIDAAWLWRRGH